MKRVQRNELLRKLLLVVQLQKLKDAKTVAGSVAWTVGIRSLWHLNEHVEPNSARSGSRQLQRGLLAINVDRDLGQISRLW